MCLTGTLPLALLSEKPVQAVVMCQPATPFYFLSAGYARRAALNISGADLAFAKQRVSSEQIELLGFRFAGDKLCQAQRFEQLEHQFGPAFKDLTIPLSDYDKNAIPQGAHSVLCGHYNDCAGHPTRQRFDRMVEYLQRSLTK